MRVLLTAITWSSPLKNDRKRPRRASPWHIVVMIVLAIVVGEIVFHYSQYRLWRDVDLFRPARDIPALVGLAGLSGALIYWIIRSKRRN